MNQRGVQNPTRFPDYPRVAPSLQPMFLEIYPQQSFQSHSTERELLRSNGGNACKWCTCSTLATCESLSFSKMLMHSWAILRCSENYYNVIDLCELLMAQALTFSRCSWYWGRLANISFMSFRLAAPSLQQDQQQQTCAGEARLTL